MRKNAFLLSLALSLLGTLHAVESSEKPASAEKFPLSLSDIRVRDPFILPDQGTYYLYAQGGNRQKDDNADFGVEVYRSQDLAHWSEPSQVFARPKEGFWGKPPIWAPEVHKLDGAYYMFATFVGRAGGRGTQILRADKPEGPFVVVGDQANTPPEQGCLDGTPWIDADGTHWMIYCHEWTQIKDGGMLAVKMTKDWTTRIGEPITLFYASQAPWVRPVADKDKFVTDGPFLHRMKNGKLVLIWSSFVKGRGYGVGQAVSDSGAVAGPWRHVEKPLVGGGGEDGGHSMIFRDFSGHLMLVFHQPNGSPMERAQIYRLKEENDVLVLDGTPDSHIEVSSKSLTFAYQFDKDKKLLLESVGSLDGAWTSPLKGPMFPSTPCHDENGPRYISPLSIVTADGSNGIDLRYESHSLEKTAPGVEHLTITLQDRVQAITVELHMRVYHDEDTIEQWLVLKNKTGKPIQVPRLSSLYFQADAKKEIHLEWYSSYTYHTAGEPFREKLNMGRRVLESRDGNRHMAGPLPAFILGFGAAPSETAGPCMITAFEWTGNTRFSFEINERKELEASVEVNQSQPPVLEDGGSMASPRSISTFSPAGIGPASRNLHHWTRSHLLPDGNRLRPIDNNSWEGCSMDVSESAILKMMEDSVNLGIELYVLDDGWFGNGAEARTSPRAGLGDWQFNKDRFPQGLDNIMKASKKLGIEFGIWFEPEMVNPKSKLFQTKPEWVMRNPGHELALQRGQAALDVANPDVQEFMFASVNDLLTAYPDIRFVKWDCNSNINNPYSPYLGADRQGNMLNAYNNGYLGVMRRLVEAHPGVDFQACGSGGGRANYGAMRYSQTFWPSDATDPRYRLRAQWNFSRFMPPLAITAHVTHAGGDAVRPKFRFDVSMMCQLGMEVDTRKSSPEYLASAKTGIAAYKQVREIVQFGDQYRHAHPTDSTTPSMNFVSNDLKKALVLAYQIGSAPNPIPFTTPVSGLDPNAVYEAVEINLPEGDATPRLEPSAERRQTGAAWMKNGLPLVFTRHCDSAAILLESKRTPTLPTVK